MLILIRWPIRVFAQSPTTNLRIIPRISLTLLPAPPKKLINTSMKILIIRFRQMGDAVLATSLIDNLKANFPDAQIDFVLNDRLADLFRGHPAISRIITFSDRERHQPLRYIWKIFRLMAFGRYNAIIDMRSTANTLPFTIFSPLSRLRIGLRKGYTRPFFNHAFPRRVDGEDMITHNLRFLDPFSRLLPQGRQLTLRRSISLHISESERADYRRYLIGEGLDLSRPILLCGVVSKLAFKTWPPAYMTDILGRIIDRYPDLQLVLNYAPGAEEEAARDIFRRLDSPRNIYINVKAASMRQLVALASFSTAYFGNEGGARHIVHAVGRPSFVVVSPSIDPATWVPQRTLPSASLCRSDMAVSSADGSSADGTSAAGSAADGAEDSAFIPAVAVSPADFIPAGTRASMSATEQYAAMTPDALWPILYPYLDRWLR